MIALNRPFLLCLLSHVQITEIILTFIGLKPFKFSGLLETKTTK